MNSFNKARKGKRRKSRVDVRPKRSVLLYQYSEDSIEAINRDYGLWKKLGLKSSSDLKVLSHQKAVFFTGKPKPQIKKLVDNFNAKYNQRIRIED